MSNITQQLSATAYGLRGPGGTNGTNGTDGADGTMSAGDVLSTVSRTAMMARIEGHGFGSVAGLFLQAQAGNISTTRASTAWAHGQGMLISAAASYPRVSDRGILVAAGRAKKVTESTDFATWTATSVTVSASAEVPPNGVTATKLLGSAVTSARLAKSYNLSLATSHIVLVLVRNDDTDASSRSSIYIDRGTDGDCHLVWTWAGQEFGAFSTQTNITGFEPLAVGDGWWLIGGKFTSDAATASHAMQFRPDILGTSKAAHLAQFDCYEGSVPVGLLRNATDSADTFRFTTSLPRVFTVSADFEIPAFTPASTAPIITLDDGDADTDNAIRVFIDTAGKVNFIAKAGGATIASYTATNAALPQTDMRATLLVNATHYRLWLGDTLVSSGAFSATPPVIARMMVGEDGAGAKLNGFVSNLFLAPGNHAADRTATAPVMKVVRLHGQSNAAGRGNYSTITVGDYAKYTFRQMAGYIWVAPDAYSTNDMVTGASFQHLYVTSDANCNLMSDSAGSIGMEPALMRNRDRNTVLVKYAVGSTQLAADAGEVEWSPTSTGEHYDLANDCYEAATDYLEGAGYKVACSEIHWFQGERDGGGPTNANAYQANLTALIAAWRTYHGDTTLPFVIYRLCSAQTAVVELATIRTAQAAVDALSAYNLLVDTDSMAAYIKVDNLHFTGDGMMLCGELGRKALAADGWFF